MASYRALLAAAVLAVGCGHGVASHAQSYPPEGYAPLLFDPADTKYVFRLNGMPWICRGDTFCKPIKIDGVADKDLAQATIEPLGFAGPRYFLSYKQANFEKGKEVVLSCTEERCGKLDSTVGDAAWLGNFQVKQGDRTVNRTAILRRLEAKAGRAQLLWCTESDCSELPVTRDTELYLVHMGSGRSDGRTWRGCATSRAPSCPAPRPRKASATSSPARRAGSCWRISRRADGRGGTAARLRPRRHPRRRQRRPMPSARPSPPPSIAPSPPATSPPPIACWPTPRGASPAPRHGRRCSRSSPRRAPMIRQAEARRLIAEARRFAQVGDFAHAEAMLQEADKQVPGFAETAQARAEIAKLRTARGQRYRER